MLRCLCQVSKSRNEDILDNIFNKLPCVTLLLFFFRYHVGMAVFWGICYNVFRQYMSSFFNTLIGDFL